MGMDCVPFVTLRKMVAMSTFQGSAAKVSELWVNKEYDSRDMRSKREVERQDGRSKATDKAREATREVQGAVEKHKE